MGAVVGGITIAVFAQPVLGAYLLMNFGAAAGAIINKHKEDMRDIDHSFSMVETMLRDYDEEANEEKKKRILEDLKSWMSQQNTKQI